MDSKRFDGFTRALSSRRTALGGLLGGGLAVLLGLPAPESVAAHRLGAKCKQITDRR